MKISQSLLKDFMAYQKGELCGSVFKARWITKTWGREWQDSENMALGRYFEYLINGETPTGYKSAPKPKFLKSATDKDKEEVKVSKMLSGYQQAHDKVAKVLELMEISGLEVVSAQKYYEKDGLEGTVDLICDYVGERIVVDLKYSGMIDDKWTKFGWVWNDLQLMEHGLQAKQYKYITGFDVYFLVVSSGKDSDVRFFKTKIDEKTLKGHKEYVDWVRDQVEDIDMMGSWDDFPGHKQCGACPLKNTCKNRANGLRVEEIEL